jgi:hypothetical protein
MGTHEQVTETSSGYRNLVSVLDDALQGAEKCAGYALHAEAVGDERLGSFFRDVQRVHARVAERAQRMLGDGDHEPRPASVRPNAIPAEGDPGDVSSGQDIFP